MSEVYLAGAGMIPFGVHAERILVDMAGEAAALALQDARLEPARVDMGFFASATAAPLFKDVTVGQNVYWQLGINQIPIFNVENACTSGSAAFCLACNAIAAGQAQVVMVAGGEKMCVPEMGLLNSGATELDTQLGLVTPASFAMRAVRHMAEFGTTPEQMASVAVKNRRHAAMNPMAQFRKPITAEDVLSSPMIADPLTRLQCCPIADGAAAVVLCSPEVAKETPGALKVRAWAYGTGDYQNPQDMARWGTDYRTCAKAYELAGMKPDDLDLVECHDAFTIGEILHYEALRLCEPGQGGKLAASGETALGGRIPVNPSGGLLSRGHPPGGTGLAQLWELAVQLRGQAGERQVKGASAGLAHCMGGDKDGDSKSCTAIIITD
jgi:acetyl-CoA acetyltransferase